MKKRILLLLFILFNSYTYSQVVNKINLDDIDSEYLQINFKQYTLLKRHSITIIYESGKGRLKDNKTNKEIKFETLPEVLKYLEQYGFNIVSLYFNQGKRNDYILILQRRQGVIQNNINRKVII